MAAAAAFAEAGKSPVGAHMEVKKELHARYATPTSLWNELFNLLGADAKFEIQVKENNEKFSLLAYLKIWQMRHNVYNIVSSKEFDMVSSTVNLVYRGLFADEFFKYRRYYGRSVNNIDRDNAVSSYSIRS
ncbi:hypothetical protein GLAREA_06290 [Glarea lozoyensis ATCC 20868]|uniref:Uncharacterized protein n=1 Tax=Glarea lozoyensis (strain ATCC 20868 / MF5171) TaxID=1116229 RepID=S3E4G1_GLAL2|nr:uncharacterized protein GLAREA_06290 [Glarea lozoyensis ATCC 20868]EPE33278.1 hypothetical protein GLAREA_06290 [Glarea lozoyensis ATCC 20868]